MQIKRALFWLAKSKRLRALLLTLVALLCTALGVVLYATSALGTLEGNTIDTRFSIRGKEATPKNIVVVNVNADTFNRLNLLWPFPRAVDGQLISRIAAQHPAAIAFDVQLSEKSAGNKQQSQNDELALLQAIDDAKGRVVFSTTETDGHGGMRFLGSADGTTLLHEVHSQPANGLFPSLTSGGVIRQMSYSISGLKTLAVATAEVATHRHINRAQFAGGDQWIDFTGPRDTFPSMEFSDVLGGHAPPNFFRNKIVVVGASAPVLQDIHPTSTDNLMPGPEIQANAINTVMHGIPLGSAPGWVNIAMIVLLAVAVPLASLRIGPVAAAGVALGLGLAYTVAAQLLFNSGVVMAFVYPIGALVLSAGGSLAVQLLTEAFERVRVRDLFSRFVPENVVDEVLASADGLRLGGIQREGTVMFTDLRGFTSFAESLRPDQVIDVLNHYLSEMSDAILDHGGTLVAYMGDGIMAVFGAPLPQDNHADRALATAREMLDVRLPRFNQWLNDEGLSDKGFRMGIGLNSGSVMSGHVGSERRVEYTAVGDTTNTASRIEGLTKGTPHQLLLSGRTKDALMTAADDLTYVGDTEIRGRVAHMQLWSLAEDGAAPVPAPASSEPESIPVSAPGV